MAGLLKNKEQAAKKGKDKPQAKGKQKASGGSASAFFNAPGRILAPRLIFVAAVVLLCVLGIVMIYSSSSIEAYAKWGSPFFFVKRQLIFLALSVIVCVVLSVVPYRVWSKPIVAWILWVIAIGMLAVLYFKGNTTLGATRSLTIAGFDIQPTEFAKVAVLLLEAVLTERRRSDLMSMPVYAASCAGTFVLTILLIFVQPDLGTAIILVVGFFALLLLGGAPIAVLVGIVVAGVAYFVVISVLQPYHLDRLATMLNPWADPLDTGYQSVQGFLALGSGGIFGKGLGMSEQKYMYLPYAYNDFIFAIIGEELGLIGATVTLLLFAALIYSGLLIARMAPDLFGSVMVGGFVTMIGFQALVNMAMVVGIAPVTGKALPFISYGGSSLVATMIMVGLIISVSMRSKIDARYEKRRDNLLVMEGGRSANKPQGGANKPKKGSGKPSKPGFAALFGQPKQASAPRNSGSRNTESRGSGSRGNASRSGSRAGSASRGTAPRASAPRAGSAQRTAASSSRRAGVVRPAAPVRGSRTSTPAEQGRERGASNVYSIGSARRARAASASQAPQESKPRRGSTAATGQQRSGSRSNGTSAGRLSYSSAARRTSTTKPSGKSGKNRH